MRILPVIFALSAMTLCAADVTGTWKAVAQDKAGTYKRTFVFRQDGTKLTGTTSSDRWGKSKIENGKIEGDALSFTVTIVFDVGDLKVPFTGKAEGNEMKLTAEASGRTLVFVAKRAP